MYFNRLEWKFTFLSPHGMKNHSSSLQWRPSQKIYCFSILPHLSLKNPHISCPFRRNLWLRRKPAKRNGKEENHYEKQQRTERSPGSGSYGQVQDAGCQRAWCSRYLLNYDVFLSKNSKNHVEVLSNYVVVGEIVHCPFLHPDFALSQ